VRVDALRRRMGTELAAAARSGDVGHAALTADRLKAVAIATMGRSGTDDVDVDSLELGTRGASAILGFHPEHLRRMIRSGRLLARREGGDYRVELRQLWPILDARHRAPGSRRSRQPG
jgi:hypothetical protein